MLKTNSIKDRYVLKDSHIAGKKLNLGKKYWRISHMVEVITSGRSP